MADDDKPPFDPSAAFTPAPATESKPEFNPNAAFSTTKGSPDVGGMVDKAAPYLNAVPMVGPVLSIAARNREYLTETAKNVPHSAAEFAKNTAQPFLHPIDTASSLKDLGLGLLEKNGIVPGNEHEKYADAVGKFFVDRYGSVDAAKESFKKDPVGVAGDLSMLLTGGETALGRLPGLAGETARAAGAAGRVIDPLAAAAPVAQTAANVVGRGAGELAGVFTGAGYQPLREAARSGFEGGAGAEAFRANMRGQAPLEDAVTDARKALDQLRTERGNAYRQSMSKTGAVGADTTVLDFGKIDNAVMKANGIQTYNGRYGTGPTQVLSPKTEGIRTEMTDAIDHWKRLDPAEFHSPEGIDALKKQLGDIRDATQYGTPERVAADKIYNAVRQTIVDQVPEYAKVMKGYEQASKQIKEIETTLSLKPNANIDTSLRKLQSTLRDNVNTSFGRRGELANFLVNAGAPHLMERLAGQALHSWAPRGLARIAAMESLPAAALGLTHGVPAAAAAAALTLPMTSPRLMGELVHGVSRAARQFSPAANLIRPARQIGQFERSPYGDQVRNPYAP